MAKLNWKPILFDQGWEVIEEGITKTKRILEGSPEPPFTSEKHIMIYTTIHNMCIQRPPYDHAELLYIKYKEVIEEYMTSVMTDMTLAKETEANFKEYLQRDPQTNPGIDLSVTILTTGFWPSYKSSDFHLPFEMAAVLLLFNDSDQLSFSKIMSQLNLADDDVVRLLHSFCGLKYKILNKVPNTKSISSDDVFEFNSKFTDKMRRIKIPLPIVDEKKKIIELVDKDRKFVVDACLICIMKSRKALNHQQLITECVKQLSQMFKPDLKLIKKRIEDLINRDYLERDSEDSNLYRYLA